MIAALFCRKINFLAFFDILFAAGFGSVGQCYAAAGLGSTVVEQTFLVQKSLILNKLQFKRKAPEEFQKWGPKNRKVCCRTRLYLTCPRVVYGPSP